ncbi:MAG: metal-dependent transcriptional regulator [Candidatus Omnitrophota bacterium]
MLSDRAEEILERLWIEVVEQKGSPDIRLFRDNLAFKELLEQKYVTMEGKNPLTNKGLEEAERCVRRHRLAERLLVDLLNVKESLIHEVGCKFEHALQKGVEENVCILLGHPTTCPHGTPIPPGECCGRMRKKHESIILPLSEMKKRQRGKIVYLRTENKQMLNKIIAIGALPNTTVTLLQATPSYLIKIGNSQFAIDRDLAEQIHVRIL